MSISDMNVAFACISLQVAFLKATQLHRNTNTHTGWNPQWLLVGVSALQLSDAHQDSWVRLISSLAIELVMKSNQALEYI